MRWINSPKGGNVAEKNKDPAQEPTKDTRVEADSREGAKNVGGVVGDVVWDGDRAGVVVGHYDDGTVLVGRFASVERTGATLSDERPVDDEEAAQVQPTTEDAGAQAQR